MDELRAFPRTPKTNADAFFWEYGAGGLRAYQYWNEQASQKMFEYRLDTNPPRAARAYALFQVALYDSYVACWDAKYTYWAIRPFQLDPNFKPLLTTPNHPSYPAAHGCASTAAATALGYLFPRDAAGLKALSDEAAFSRIWGGIHYRSDIVGGIELGRRVAEKAIDRVKSDTD
jgi:membrane-associated phospholipid phosphatase